VGNDQEVTLWTCVFGKCIQISTGIFVILDEGFVVFIGPSSSMQGWYLDWARTVSKSFPIHHSPRVPPSDVAYSPYWQHC
jgi:hypothetical protein